MQWKKQKAPTYTTVLVGNSTIFLWKKEKKIENKKGKKEK